MGYDGTCGCDAQSCGCETQNCGCDSQGCATSGRQFLTADEKIARLEQYKSWLTKETQGVDEVIAKIKKSQ